MLGLSLLYFIGKYFYRLAEGFNKNKWYFAFLGNIVDYVGTFIESFIRGILDAFPKYRKTFIIL